MRKLLSFICLGCLLVSCGDDSSSSPEPVESSSSQEIESSSSEKSSSSYSSAKSSSSEKSSSSVRSSSSGPYVEKHLAWNYLNPDVTYKELVDKRDGHVYKYIEYEGNFRIMAENLNYSDSVSNPNLAGQTWCYQNSLDSCSKYGRYYTWTAAFNVEPSYSEETYAFSPRIDLYSAQGLCPEGWKVYVTNREWQNLLFRGFRGKHLCALKGWDSDVCIDTVGFAALPGGRYEDGVFTDVGKMFNWWSPMNQDKTAAHMGFMSADGGRQTIMKSKTVAAPIRCYQMLSRDACDEPDNPYCGSSSSNSVESSSDAGGTDIESSESENVESSDSVPSSSSDAGGTDIESSDSEAADN